MKRIIVSLLLAVSVLFGTIPVNASAMEQQRNGQTTITYTAGASWTISIPASVNVNADPYLKITATNVNIEYAQKICVYIDGNSTYENGGNFYLHKNDGSNEKMPCGIYRSGSPITGLDYKICTFNYDGVDYNEPIEFRPAGGTPGTYTGTIYFRIELE